MMVVYLTLKYLLSMNYAPCIVLAMGETAVNKTDQVLVIWSIYPVERKKQDKQIKIEIPDIIFYIKVLWR